MLLQSGRQRGAARLGGAHAAQRRDGPGPFDVDRAQRAGLTADREDAEEAHRGRQEREPEAGVDDSSLHHQVEDPAEQRGHEERGRDEPSGEASAGGVARDDRHVALVGAQGEDRQTRDDAGHRAVRRHAPEADGRVELRDVEDVTEQGEEAERGGNRGHRLGDPQAPQLVQGEASAEQEEAERGRLDHAPGVRGGGQGVETEGVVVPEVDARHMLEEEGEREGRHEEPEA